DAPGAAAVLIAGFGPNRSAVLPRPPDMLEGVSFDDDAAGVFQLEGILDGDPRRLPRQPLRHQVAAHLDVVRDQIRERRIGAAENDVLARGLQQVVDDLERPGAERTADRLRVAVRVGEVGDGGIDHGDAHPVHQDAPAEIALVIAMEVRAIDDDVGRLRVDTWLGADAELDQVRYLTNRSSDADVEADQAIAARARFGTD